jgi:hypothetical protein
MIFKFRLIATESYGYGALHALGSVRRDIRVAPTRYGDQTLAAGEHLAPGFSPGAGALRLRLREPLCMYRVSILRVF